jgi:hypothetical protein
LLRWRLRSPPGLRSRTVARVEPLPGQVVEAAASERDASGAPPRATDVWSRADRRSRGRAYKFLIVNWVLFCGLCIFVHWLHVVQPFDFRLESYITPLKFWGPQEQTLNDFVLFPINVTERPLHALVLGLAFASLAAVPISIAILYRFPFALPFVAAVFLFAHLPWLAITLLGSCVLAAVRPFRLRFHYGAALVGLLPVVTYLYMASRGGGAAIDAYSSPEERQWLVAPWIITILAACLMLAVILGLARLVNYRPGVITPVSAVMFATPMILFHAGIGADELAYRVLLQQWGPQSSVFAPSQDATGGVMALFRSWTPEDGALDAPDREYFLGLWAGRDATRREIQRRITSRFVHDLLEARRDAYEACKRFIASYPKSRYVPSVLYLQGRTLDTRLAEVDLVDEQPRRTLYSDFPHVQSRAVWERLLAGFPESRFATIAGLRLGQLRLRAGDIEGAIQCLERAASVQLPATQPDRTEVGAEVLSDVAAYALEARELLELIRANYPDPRYGGAPLAQFAALDPHRAGFTSQLRELLARFPDCRLSDEVCTRWAASQENLRARTDALEILVCRFRGTDAFPAAAFYLGELEVLRLGRDDPKRWEHGRALLREVVASHPDVSWAVRASELLNRLPAAPVSESRL